MAKTEEIRVRVTPEDKQRAKELFESYGLTTSAAITMFIRQSLMTNGLPFNVEGEARRNPSQALRNTP